MLVWLRNKLINIQPFKLTIQLIRAHFACLSSLARLSCSQPIPFYLVPIPCVTSYSILFLSISIVPSQTLYYLVIFIYFSGYWADSYRSVFFKIQVYLHCFCILYTDNANSDKVILSVIYCFVFLLFSF